MLAHAAFPERVAYPGGYDRVKWHLEKGVQTFKRFLVKNPRVVGFQKAASVIKR